MTSTSLGEIVSRESKQEVKHNGRDRGGDIIAISRSR